MNTRIVLAAAAALLIFPAFGHARVPTSGIIICDQQGCRGSAGASEQPAHALKHSRLGQGATQETRVRQSSLVALINYKLARWVHRTGKCGAGESEQLATYYWQGTRTATGAHFNPNGMTAAHLHLPFGTRLTVTNPHNGRSIAITINDRGPYTDAKFDLARGAARALGLNTSSYVCIAGL